MKFQQLITNDALLYDISNKKSLLYRLFRLDNYLEHVLYDVSIVDHDGQLPKKSLI